MRREPLDDYGSRTPDHFACLDLNTRLLPQSYSSLGWRVTPLKGKRPTRKNWPDNAESSEIGIVTLIEGGNIGLVTGEASGVVVLDIDPRNDGDASICSLADRLGPLPPSLTCLTGGGGRHLYFRYFEGAKSGKPMRGVDFQVDRRCVVLPPSLHPDTGLRYEWVDTPTDAVISELPDRWKQMLGGVITQRQHPDNLNCPIPEGTRNDTLFKFAIELAKSGASESKIARLVAEENALRCVPPLEPLEISQLVKNSLNYRLEGQSILTRFQQAVGYTDMPTGRKAALWALSLFADQHGRNCYPTLEQTAQRAGMTRESAGRHLRAAESEGWIIRVPHRRVSGPGFNYSYVLQVPPVS